MLVGYITGGFLVLVLIPTVIYLITSAVDKVYRLEILQNSTLRWIIIACLLIPGSIYGIWSIVIQNIVGKGGPVQIANIEISPKTENLVVTGPYKSTRNPMMFGMLLIYLALALIINSITALLLVVAILVFMLTVVAKLEETRLLQDFGNQYEEYRKSVSKFIPWIQRKNN